MSRFIFSAAVLGTAFFLLPIINVLAQETEAGQPGVFLDYAGSARSLGMGQARVAVADDAGATYINPAGLSQLTNKDFVALYSVLAERAGYGFMGYAQPVPRLGHWGISVANLHVPGYTRRNFEGLEQGSFNNTATAVLLSNSFPLGGLFSFGTTLKWVREQVGSFSANGYGADVGLMAYLHPKWQMGAALHNVLSPKITFQTQRNEYPQDVQLGLRFRPIRPLVLAVDGVKKEQNSAKARFGAEYRINPLLAVRAGINEREVTAGLGVALGVADFDYAFGYISNSRAIQGSDGLHRLGIHLRFGARPDNDLGRLSWEYKGQVYLTKLREAMNASPENSPSDLADMIDGARNVLRHNGYPKESDAYAVQGYIAYFKRNFEASVHYLERGLASDPGQAVLASHAEKVKTQFMEQRRQQWLVYGRKEMKRAYKQGNWKRLRDICQAILQQGPDKEASLYLRKAEKHLMFSLSDAP